MARGNRDCGPGGGGLGWRDAVARSEEVHRPTAERVADRLTADPPVAASRKIAAEQILDQLSRGGVWQGLAFVGPILEFDETSRLGALRIEPSKFRELA